MNVTLSIVIPAYNAEKYLEACVCSVISNTYRDFEILLIDDGSTDSTGEICDRLQSIYPQIRVFHTDNRGLPSARNLGIEHACGQFIGFVDADDLIAPAMYVSLTSAMESEVQLAACKFLRCKRSQAVTEPDASMQRITQTQAEAAAQILCGGYGPYVWNKLYRKDILDVYNVRFLPDSQGCEDLYFNATYLQYCSSGVFLDQPMYYYIDTEGSIMKTFRESRTVSHQYVSLPRANRFAAAAMKSISEELVILLQSRAAMYYQTVLRKLEDPDESYIREAVSYVKQHKNTLLRYRWGFKYYLSALVLSVSYSLWAKIFRRGLS